MQLNKILKDIDVLGGNYNGDEEINDIKINSKEIGKGDIFIALKGEKFNGNNYIEDAFARGASAVISDEKQGENIIKVDNARASYALACKNYFDRACDRLKIVAVTGTNGKTTTVSTIGEILRFAGKKVGVIGTLGAKIDQTNIETGFTTPDPYLLHQLFSEMEKKGCEYAIMEASAHALFLDKLEGINFELGVLTNITEDHLDFFKDMDNYSMAKYQLFKPERVKMGLVCTNDNYCKKLLAFSKVPILTYGFGECYDICADEVKKSFGGSSFICDCMGEIVRINTNLVGEYNILNSLAAIGVCRLLGLSMEQVKYGIGYTIPVEGRFNTITLNDSNIIIDYAHTPDGLEKVLTTAKDLSDKPLVVVFGCGGNRDKQKRPIMGKIACDYADKVIITSDNPRFEMPYDIISDIRKGAHGKYEIIENRKDAIQYALSKYCHGETIVIAGKGGEKYQEIKGKKIPYNDFDVVYNFFQSQVGSLKDDNSCDINIDELE